MEPQLLAERSECLKACNDLLTTARSESRTLTAEETEQYDKAWARAGDIERQVQASRDAATSLQVRQASLAEAQGRTFTSNLPSGLNVSGSSVAGSKNIVINFRNKQIQLKPGTSEYARATQQYNEGFEAWLRNPGMGPSASLQVSEGQYGGMLVMPEQVNYDLLRIVDEVVVMRRIARKFVLKADSMGAVYRKTKASGFVRGTELTELSTPVTDPKFGKKKLTPTHYTGYTNPTNDFLRQSEIPATELVIEEMQIPIREGEETEFMTGDGNGKALGVFTASNDGIDTSRDVNVGATSGPTYPGLCAMIGKVGDNYLIPGQCYWVCHGDFLTKCWQLADSTGQPILKTEPNGSFFYNLMGWPVVRSDFAPNTFTSNQYVAVFGNFQYYWIADHPVTELQILDQIEALKNRTVFLFRRKMDALPVRPSAFARAKCAVIS